MMNVNAALRNVVVMLQADPRNYKKFGVYWWPMKAILKRRYTKDHLFMLGDYMPKDAEGLIEQGDLRETLQAAFQEYQQNDRYNLGRDRVETAHGEPYLVYDPDAGI